MIVSAFVACAQDKPSTKKSKIKPPKSYVAYHTKTPIEIDGKDDDKSWKSVPFTDLFIDIEGVKIPKYKTQVKMLWDETYFYILAKIEEPHVWADITKHDAIIFHNNDFEVFVEPDNNTYDYYELEINALNTSWDLYINKPYRELDNYAVNNFEIKGLKSAVSINGTLNNPKDTDKGWMLEIAIPWDAYKRSYFQKIVPRNKFWHVNFSRVNWDFDLVDGTYQRKKRKDGTYLPEYNWVWSPQDAIDIHRPEKWGYVFFSSQEAGEKTLFKIPVDEQIKWKLYEMYRKQKAYNLKHHKWITSLEELYGKEFSIEGKKIHPILENHSQGYNLIVKSPFTEDTIIMREGGKVVVRKSKK